ncbi:MAG: hypothetical protein IJ480_07440 [Clostridia bacterium]|nr:hypothetical protein [Clostridia bacterium]
MHIKDRMTAFLLHNAGPSIRLRIRREIVGDSTPAEESTLLTEIMAEPVYGLIAACQKENGWLGNGFHGPNKNAGPYENQEVGTKYLAEKGFGKENPVLQGAMNAFVTVPLSDPCYRTRGKVYDEFKYAANGQNLIRCACIARAGFDDVIDIEPQIRLSLESFRRVLEVESILEISRTVKSSKYRLFNNFEKWPCRYHFDILAHTESWKTPEACRMLADAFAALMRTDRPELIGVGAASWAGHVLGTLGCYTEGFSTRCVKDGVSLIQLETVEWMCRCGLYPYLPVLREEVGILLDSVDADGICRAPVDEDWLHGISTYGGQQLEADWKTPVRKSCDITFRALLCGHYAGVL